MSKEANILDIIEHGIAGPKKMNPLLNLLWSLDDNIELSEKKDKLLRKLVDDFRVKKISNDEFEQQTINILQEYRSPSPRHHKSGSAILREKYSIKKQDFRNIKPINVRTSPEIEKAMEEHRSGTPSGLSRLFTPSPHSESTPSPPIITDRISTGEPTKFGDTPSPLLRPNPIRDTGTLGLNSIGRSINVGQPKHISTPLLADEDDYDPDNCSDCEGGCCGGRKRKTKKRKKRKTKKRKKRKKRTKRRKKRTRKQKGGGLLEILGFGRSSNSTSDTLREIAQNQLSEQKTLTVTPEEAKHATNDGFQDSNKIQKEQDAEKEQQRREANRTFYVESAQQDWDDINTSIKRIYPSGGEGNPFHPNIGTRPNNFEKAKYFKEKLLEEAKRQANIHGGKKRRKKTKRKKTRKKRGKKRRKTRKNK